MRKHPNRGWIFTSDPEGAQDMAGSTAGKLGIPRSSGSLALKAIVKDEKSRERSADNSQPGNRP
jgi:hypothetical protein